MSTDFVVARGQQVVALLLSTVPLAERMLLYNVALTAWVMLPQRSVRSNMTFVMGRVPQVRQSVPGPKKIGDPDFLLRGTH